MSLALTYGFVLAAFVAGLLVSPRRHASGDAASAGARDSDIDVEGALTRLADRVESLDRAHARSDGALEQHLAMLRNETTAVARALSNPQSRGRWGELQLQRVVELAGMSAHARNFAEQVDIHAADSRRLRPDMVVAMPNGRSVVIDAKAPADAYLRACDAPDDSSAAPHLKVHAAAVHEHARALAGRGYARAIDGAIVDVVVLFLPSEHLFSTAVRARPALLEETAQLGVLLASPTTLITLLRAVAAGWREERVAHDAAEIARVGRELHDRLARMSTHLAGIGTHLTRATDAYNAAVGSYESRVLVQARRLRDLDASEPSADLPALDEVSVQARRVERQAGRSGSVHQ